MPPLITLLCLAHALEGVPATGKSPAEFAPKGWAVESELTAELNGDALPDRVVVLLQVAHGDDERHRALLWLHGTKDGGFELIDSNVGLLAPLNGLGMKGGTAEPELELNKNVLNVSNWGGSADSYGSTHRFRFEKGVVRLIGVDKSNMNTLTMEESGTSTNLVTGASESYWNPPQDDGTGQPTGKKGWKKKTKVAVGAPQRLRDVVEYDRDAPVR
ncbi:MAG: hypothetical protein U0228_06615 [Myxococcaceae bacterium]